MVGVAGRSKGCTTCRRRKKKCDLQEPACNRCLDSGKTCEGYARYPVFLNRTNQGLMKRDRLEEAKENGIREEQHCQRKSEPSKPILASASSMNVLRQGLIRRKHVTMNSMPLLPSNANVSEAQLISAFWECYVPSSSIAQAGSPCPWLQQSIYLANPPSTLRLSLKALAMVRLGWLYKDDASVRGGRVIYGDALRELQKALYDERLRWQDETMATCKVLAVYELSESTSTSSVGHNSHTFSGARRPFSSRNILPQISNTDPEICAEGGTNLLIMRGPDKYKNGSPLARAMLENTRLTALFQSLLHRKASPLGSHEWYTRPWSLKRKDQSQMDFSQRLYDHGFALAALLEEIDCANLADDNRTEVIQKYLRRCSALDARFNLWYQELVQGSDGPVYWLTPANDSVRLGPANEHYASILNNDRPFSFPNLKTANIVISYWALKLTVSSTIAKICSAALSTFTSTAPTPLQATAQLLLAQHGDEGRLENATNIMQSMAYCSHDRMGLLGPQGSLFALRAALLSLEGSQIEELKLCAEMYRELYEKRGLRFAKQLLDIGPKWSRDPVLDLSGTVGYDIHTQ